MNRFDALRVEFGTLNNLAEKLEIKPSAVYQWVTSDQIPIKHIKRICELSEGRLTSEVLRPDLFGGK